MPSSAAAIGVSVVTVAVAVPAGAVVTRPVRPEAHLEGRGTSAAVIRKGASGSSATAIAAGLDSQVRHPAPARSVTAPPLVLAETVAPNHTGAQPATVPSVLRSRFGQPVDQV